MSVKAPLCANHRFGSLFEELPEPHQRRGARGARSDLALGHNLHSTTHRLLLSGGGLGRLLPLLCGLVSLSRGIDTRLTLCALEAALWSRLPEPGLIHHCNPYENAKAESFFRTLKMEELYIKDYKRFEEAEQNIAEFIEEVYNQKRLHSSLGYLPPVGFEAAYILEARS